MIRWKIGEFLKKRGITVYQLHKQLGGDVSRTALYRIARGETRGLDFDVLEKIMIALEGLSRTPLGIADVLARDE